VVSRQYIKRSVEPRDQLPHELIFAVGGVVREVAGDQHGIRAIRQPSYRFDDCRESADGITTGPGRADVGIAQLDDDERLSHGAHAKEPLLLLEYAGYSSRHTPIVTEVVTLAEDQSAAHLFRGCGRPDPSYS
jgi:hypothetical protein